MPPKIHPTATQAQRVKEAGVSVSTIYKAREAIRNGIPELSEAMRDGTISVHRAQRIARLPRHEQRDVLQGRKKLPKEMSPQVNGYVAGYRDALSAAADLVRAAGHRSLATKIRRLVP
jgi:hypothetical protein